MSKTAPAIEPGSIALLSGFNSHPPPLLRGGRAFPEWAIFSGFGSNFFAEPPQLIPLHPQKPLYIKIDSLF